MYFHAGNVLEQRSLPAYGFDSRMKLKDHDLNGIVEELQDLLPGIVPDGTEVRVELADCELRVMTDALKLKGAFVNIIENAADALSPGGLLTLSTGQIRFSGDDAGCPSAYASGGCAFFFISDTGVGMDEMTKERIFEPFFTTKPGEKRGLGSTIARRVIECHNGTMNVESSVNGGTKVRIYLPLMRTDRMGIPIPLPSSFSIAGPDGSMHR